MDRVRVLLGHLNSMGDCLFATVIARQIKEIDYPNCHLTWAVNSKSRPAVDLNPYVDAVWEIPTEMSLTAPGEWDAFLADVDRRKQRGDFDHVFLTQIIGDNWLNYDGGIRSSTYNNYPHEITVPHQPILCLSDSEIENVRIFAEGNDLHKYEHVILVECGPDSFTTSLNPTSAYQLAVEVTAVNSRIAFILSSNTPIASPRPGILDASQLTFRENAELAKYCNLFIGCCSGISWLVTSTGSKPLEMILVVNENNGVLPSAVYDHEYLNLRTDHLIEIKSAPNAMRKLRLCLDAVLTSGFCEARNTFHERVKPRNTSFLEQQIVSTLRKLRFREFFSCLARHTKRKGALIFVPQLTIALANLGGRSITRLLKTTGFDRISRV